MTSIKEGATGLAAQCLAEVADLHRFFEAWLNGDGAAAVFDRCERALHSKKPLARLTYASTVFGL